MYVLSIHPDGEYFKVALLSLKNKKMKIEFINDLRKDIVDLNQLKRKIDTVTKQREDKVEVVSALGPDEVLTRTLELPLRKKRSVLKALPFQLESILPFSQELSTTLPVITKHAKSSKVKLYSFMNETMDNHIQNIKTFGFNPDWVTTVSSGLARFTQTFASESSDCLVFHFGWARSYLIALSNGEEIFSTTLQIGLKNFIDALKEDFPEVEEVSLDLLEVQIEESAKNEDSDTEMSRVLFEVQKQIYRVIEFVKRVDSEKECEGVIFTGYTEIVKKITKWMEAFPGEAIDLIPHLEYETKEIASYALEIGLALDSLQRDEKTIQLRVGRFLPRRMYEKVKRKAKVFFGMSCLTSALMLATMTSYFVKVEHGHKERFSRIVNLSGADIDLFPFMQKPFVGQEEMKKGISQLIKGFKTVKPEGIAKLEPILISETIEWILHSLNKEIDVLNIHYDLTSYPTAEEPIKETIIDYTIKYKASTKENAKAFYESLAQSGEVFIEDRSFTEKENGYTANFTFKS